ncbi:MAG: phosphoserine phosphatase SerB [Betaproteobacteria bacterium]|nr:phosphoserine phosphatase SerB [Betaproteobacteria bacterium]
MHLVIQGPDVETTALKELAKLSGAGGIEQAAPNVFRLKNASPADGIGTLCAEQKLDYAFVPEDRKLAGFRLLVTDMDSTLIAIETIDELADLVGKKSEVAEITAQAMRGEIPYDESLRRRVAVLKGLGEAALERVYQGRVRLSPGADQLIAGAKKAGLKILLVSGGFTHVTERLKARLKLDYTRANTLKVAGGRLTGEIEGRIVNADVKREALLAVRDELGLKKEQIIAVGDGANDLKFMAEAGISVAYRAKPAVNQQATHAISHAGLDGVLNLFN